MSQLPSKLLTQTGIKRFLICALVEIVGLAIMYQFNVLELPLYGWAILAITGIPVLGVYNVYAEEIAGWVLGRSA